MGKGKFIALILIIVVAVSLYYYFFIHAHNVRVQEFFKLVDDYTENVESFSGVRALPEDGEISDLDYYRQACSNIKYSEVGEDEYRQIVINRMDCDWDRINDMLKTIPEDDIIKQYFYLELSTTNAMRTFMNSFREKLVDIHYKKGLSFYANSEALVYIMFIAGSASSWSYTSNAIASCWHVYNESTECLPVITETKVKASEDLLKEIDLGEGFISSCTQHKIFVLFRPPELDYIINTRTRADCEYIAGIYRDILEEVKNSDMDVNGKYMIYNTFYVISKNVRGYELRSVEELNEFTNILKKHLPPEYKDAIPLMEKP